MPDITTVAIVGAGAIGASLAARLFDSGKHPCIIAHGERKARYISQGFIINGIKYQLPIYDPDELDPQDLIILAVKITISRKRFAR